MKKLIIACSLLFYAGCLYAQNKEIETEIRALEQTEVQAVLKKDTVTLLKLWDKDYVVNSPENRVVFAGTTTVDRPVMKKARTSFTREVEQVIIRGDIVISTGGETVTPAGDEPQTGQTVKRRYTNIWMKQATGWKLIARHANVICQPN